MSSDTQSVLSHAFLAASSGWAFSQCTDLPFAAVGFGLYFVNGVLGVACYGIYWHNLQMYKVYSSIFRFTLILIIPLISTQLYIMSGFTKEAALLHFIFPFLYFVTLQFIKSKRSGLPLQIFQAASLISMTYISLMTNRYYGLSTIVSYTISFYIIGTTALRNSDLRQIQYKVFKVTYIFGLSLITTEFYLFAGFPEEYCWLNLVFPTYDVIVEEILENNVDHALIDLSNACEIIVAGYASFVKDKNLYGFAFTLIHLASCFGSDYHRVNTFCILCGFANIAALFMLKGPQF